MGRRSSSAKVAVKNHHHSMKNPSSMYQIETPLEQVMNAEMIAYPNTKLMCSVNVDGSAAAVLVSEHKAPVIVFHGAIRNRTGDRQVTHLEYEAFEPMAIGEMTRIGSDLTAKHEVSAIACTHRIGRLDHAPEFIRQLPPARQALLELDTQAVAGAAQLGEALPCPFPGLFQFDRRRRHLAPDGTKRGQTATEANAIADGHQQQQDHDGIDPKTGIARRHHRNRSSMRTAMC